MFGRICSNHHVPFVSQKRELAVCAWNNKNNVCRPRSTLSAQLFNDTHKKKQTQGWINGAVHSFYLMLIMGAAILVCGLRSRFLWLLDLKFQLKEAFLVMQKSWTQKIQAARYNGAHHYSQTNRSLKKFNRTIHLFHSGHIDNKLPVHIGAK